MCFYDTCKEREIILYIKIERERETIETKKEGREGGEGEEKEREGVLYLS